MSITQTISDFPTPLPNRNTDTPSEFSDHVDSFLGHINDFVDECNTWASQANTTASQVNSDASSASDSADQAAASANFKGNWSDLTGALSVPASVYHLNTYWMLLEDVTDVTAEEPGTSSKWAEIVPGENALKRSFML